MIFVQYFPFQLFLDQKKIGNEYSRGKLKLNNEA